MKTKICDKCTRVVSVTNIDRHIALCDGVLRQKKTPKFSKEERKGKTYEELFGIEKANLIKSKISKSTTLAQSSEKLQLKIKHSKAVSDGMKRKYAEGWKPRCGRCKKIDYISPIAGHISVDGTWELKTAKYLDKLNVVWERNLKRFPYKNLNGSESTYCPDFYVKDWNSYIEVKGYETELDRCKWSQFPELLEVWKREKIESLEV